MNRSLLCLVLGLPLYTGCALIEFTGDTVVMTGKVATTAVKTTGAVVGTTGKITRAGVRTVAGKRSVKLERVGDSLYATVKVNGHKARLLVDTGASYVQISPRVARAIGVNYYRGRPVEVILADGSTSNAYAIKLDSVKVGSMKAKDVDALIIVGDRSTDDGLLGMSYLERFIFQFDMNNDTLILQARD